MLGIALRHGISLEELMAANPEVDARFLSVDTVLVIPLGDSSPPPLTLPTPLPMTMAEPVCYTGIERGVWCFWLAKNDRSTALENLSARIVLYDLQGEILVEEMAIPPLNVIPPGEALPLVAYFPPSLPEGFTPFAELLTALPVQPGDERYLNAKLEVSQVEVDPSGQHATVKGNISLPKNSLQARVVWLAAVAYGSEGEVLGIRKWEGKLETGEMISFELTVFSLGTDIKSVEVLVEARP